MSFSSDLLEQATHLAKRERNKPRQASLRRSVSTAYYALFHYLIEEATLNWRQRDLRPELARLFEHGKMKSACQKQSARSAKFIKEGDADTNTDDLETVHNLKLVADAFTYLQQQRHDADYNNAKEWTRTEVFTLIAQVRKAFQLWQAIRSRPEAQVFLLSLLGGNRS